LLIRTATLHSVEVNDEDQVLPTSREKKTSIVVTSCLRRAAHRYVPNPSNIEGMLNREFQPPSGFHTRINVEHFLSWKCAFHSRPLVPIGGVNDELCGFSEVKRSGKTCGTVHFGVSAD
jgi:hypothetical protein